MQEDDKPKITKQYCMGRELVFYPQTVEEAHFVQKQLFKLGMRWNTTGQRVSCVSECIIAGLVVKGGSLYYRSATDSNPYIHCDIEQLKNDYQPPLRFEEKMALEFNVLSAKVDRLTELVEKLCAEVLPADSDKPGLKETDKGMKR